MDKEQVEYLSKKEKKQLKRNLELLVQKEERKIRTIRNWVIGLLIIGVLGVGGWWVVKESSKPLPGESVADLGRQHITRAEWEKFKYNSNPPTSGSHDAEWIRAGVFDSPQGDGYLVHSLEHGYIIISYNCTKFQISNFKFQISNAYAHEEGDTLTPEEHASQSATLEGEAWKSKACEDLKKELSDFAKQQKLWKLIVVPRPQLDVPIALTAWGRIDKMDKVDKERISRFIDSYRDQGPEKTAE